jgi:hypothetical protein
MKPMSQRQWQRGWGMTEYAAVMLGLMVAWQSIDLALNLIRVHQAKFTWAMMIPLG